MILLGDITLGIYIGFYTFDITEYPRLSNDKFYITKIIKPDSIFYSVNFLESYLCSLFNHFYRDKIMNIKSVSLLVQTNIDALRFCVGSKFTPVYYSFICITKYNTDIVYLSY